MKRPPTDFEILKAIYKRYHRTFVEYTRENPTRSAKVMVPIEVETIAKSLGVDADIVFGRLYYHMEPKYGYTKDSGSKVPFFVMAAGDDRHCVQFPLLTSVLAGLWEERRRHMVSRYISVIALVVSIVSLGLSASKIWPNKSLQPTATAVTLPAGAGSAPAAAVAEH